MKRAFCDSCETEITPTNKASRDFTLEHTAPDTGHNFQLKVLWGNDASGHGRIVQGDGDLCKACLVNMLYEASIEAHRDVTNEMMEDANAADEEFNAQFDEMLGEEEEESELGDDIDPETNEVEIEDEDDFPL